MPGLWPQLRAAFVAFHLAAITLSALPTPEGGMNRGNWADPTVQAELDAWAGRFGADPDTFEERLWTFAQAYVEGYRVLLAPFLPYEELAGTEQSWKMFVAPHKFPTRLQIGARAGEGEWRTLFEEGSLTATWRRSLLRTERLRSATFRWGWPNFAGAWSRGCTALARLAFADDPSLMEVRCRFWKARSASPAEARSGALPEGRWIYTRLVARRADGTVVPARRVTDEGSEPLPPAASLSETPPPPTPADPAPAAQARP